MEEVTSMMKNEADLKNITLSQDHDKLLNYNVLKKSRLPVMERLPQSVIGDKHRFQQLSINLIQNAI